MAAVKDLTAILPSGESFDFWEVDAKYDRELHVACDNPAACDCNDGSAAKPFKTINAAAAIATPGTRVVIHAGTYRETVNPKMGGESPERMIAYEAAGDGDVLIKASVVATQFKRSEGWNLMGFRRGAAPSDANAVVWETKLNPDDFRGYNPFNAVNILHDRIFIEYGKTDMTTYLNRRGMVFVDNKPLFQVPLCNQLSSIPGSYWIEANGQTVHFRLPDDGDPKDHLIELACREQCFAPEECFLSYIKVKGLICAHAATGAPVPQRGSISCHRGHHWVIEDCTIDWSNCLGIDIGNECWHRTRIPDQVVGYQVIRRCKILNVGVCGVAGMGACGVLFEDNLFEGTGWQKMEQSWEAGGIKVHNCKNTLYRRNIFKNTIRCDAIWMDVGNENTRVTQNLFVKGIDMREFIFMEMTRDAENMIDNNIFWDVEGRYDREKVTAEPGSSGWYKLEERGLTNGYAIYGEGTDLLRISNNFIGKCADSGYFAKTVAFRLSTRGGTARDCKFFNNVFYDCKDAAIKLPTRENEAEGNVYSNNGGGYLRILYPLPTQCLDLETWQRWYGFDQKGCTAEFEVEVDADALTMTISPQAPRMFGMFRYAAKNTVAGYENLPKVAADPKIKTDYFGNTVEGDRMAGPFVVSGEKVVLNIDPRKL